MPPPHRPDVRIACDGACRGNPGPGGWAAIVRSDGKERVLKGAEPLTTNNRMELQAALAALQALPQPARVLVETDSRYLVDGMTKWLGQWQRNGWKTADRRPVANADLWTALAQAAAPHDVRWVWVRGHAGHPANERADRLANAAIDELLAEGS
ncbi:MAG: ribonuclease HI [Sphingomonadaceae bacterium]|uniref:ribonuclease HI n=1 Tax=Thermaurantiacus sp. TaxID=2820283 RepID=UPI00298EFC2F|nr:ribonuclease HI [Thermaurantiacus sp.]MCS6986602.1 ribonuclease HI [Sphingomonadaceae bacterium]MDW8414137.1 ribonuclease HI [Thermaurantiacus sp.]